MTLRADAAEKRQHIVETAYRLFKREGFHATGIDKIIAEAGVAKMTMYRHFPSKDGLIVEVLDWRTERFRRQLDQVAGAAMTPGEKIAAIFDWHERRFDSPEFHGCLFQHALAEFGKPGLAVFDAAVTNEAGQPIPARQRVADGFGKFGLLADEGELLGQPWCKTVSDRAAFALPRDASLFVGRAPDIVLDLIEFSDAPERFAGNRRWPGGGELIKRLRTWLQQNARDTLLLAAIAR